MCEFSTIGILLLLFHSINAGIPIAIETKVSINNVGLKPKAAILKPARAPPKAVPSQIVALILVASFPAFLGDRLYMAVRLTAQYEDSRRLSRIFPAAKIGKDVAK